MGFGDSSYGADEWGSGGSTPPVPPVPPVGDGHIPFACNLAQTSGGQITGSESVQIEIQPTLDLTTYGKTTWKWHFLGEAIGLTGGRTITAKIHHGTVFSDPIVATVVITTNGPFHLVSDPGAIPAGPQQYFLSWQTTNLSVPTVQGMLVVVEAY